MDAHGMADAVRAAEPVRDAALAVFARPAMFPRLRSEQGPVTIREITRAQRVAEHAAFAAIRAAVCATRCASDAHVFAHFVVATVMRLDSTDSRSPAPGLGSTNAARGTCGEETAVRQWLTAKSSAADQPVVAQVVAHTN